MSEQELKPCPCCDSKPHGIEGNKDVRQPEHVMCLKCDLELSGDGAFAKWNTRAPAQPVSAKPAGEVPEVVATVEAYGGKWAGIHRGECIGSTVDPDRQLMTIAQHTRIVAALQARAVVMPERKTAADFSHYHDESWRVELAEVSNLLLDEVACLNGKAVET